MSRDTALEKWLHQVLTTTEFECVPLTNDCSFRKYYRIMLGNTTLVAMDAPAPENPAAFVDIAKLLKGQGLTVPDILHHDLEQGFLVLTDFGDRLYLKELDQHTAPILYQDAIQALLKIHHCPTDTLDSFDVNFLRCQFDLCKTWYLEQHLKIPITSDMYEIIDKLVKLFAEVIQEQPQVFIHRDYHSRNLMILDKKNPGILDFQGAMKGPLTHDLVSLLQDCYIGWPRECVEQWVLEFQEQGRAAGLLSDTVSSTQFLRWFDLTGLQRHLKNLGTFSRQHYAYGRAQYLNDLAMPLKYIREAFERYSELHCFSDFFQQLTKK